MLRSLFVVLIAAFTTAAAVSASAPALACGCVHPPVPESFGEFAVNQQGEQILFEVPGDGTVTAHVLIRYAGDPARFAWLVPVPSVPELALSEAAMFSLLDQETAPSITITVRDACPDPDYICATHWIPTCGGPGTLTEGSRSDTSGGDIGAGGGGHVSGTAGGVVVLQSQQVGDYETVVFSADEAAGTVTWLQANGFIVNDTMTPFMQPYLDAGMVFVAAKLVPGAGADAIRPLKMTYAAQRPMIPLKLTAVAAEPHLTVTSYILGDSPFRAQELPSALVDPDRIARDAEGRFNYPMVLARTIDEAGGNAFVTEYQGDVPAVFDAGGFGCCNTSDGSDACGLGGDGECQCPRTPFDRADCDDASPGVVEAVAALDQMRAQYRTLTRITTRLSPEEMTFDPQFEPFDGTPFGRLTLMGSEERLERCVSDIIDTEDYRDITRRMACASLYCGAGACVVTAAGVGCRCDAGHVARTFTDLDGQPSVTCQPRQALVDLGADIEVPDACAGVSLTDGECVDVGGFPSADCAPGAAGVLAASGSLPVCWESQQALSSPGAEDFSDALATLAVCAPASPPTCGDAGWLVPNTAKQIQGVSCRPTPPQSRFEVPPEPACDGNTVVFGAEAAAVRQRQAEDDCSGGGGAAPAWFAVLLAVVALRRRRARTESGA